jgi:hypothetical protein
MELTPETVAQEQHKDWLCHPTTIQMLKNFVKQKQLFVSHLSEKSSDVTIHEYQFRLISYGISTIDKIKSWITNTEKFLLVSEQTTNRK